MKCCKFLSAILLSIFLFGIIGENANAVPTPKRRPRWMGNQGAHCPKEWPLPPVCDVPAGNYKSANGEQGKHLNAKICGMIKAQLQKTPKCVFVIGYRNCRTNSAIRGAARNSFHLCGKAADLRNGTCGALGSTHLRGSAKHQHVSPLGGCY